MLINNFKLSECQRHLGQVCCHGGVNGEATNEQKEGHPTQNLETTLLPSQRWMAVLLRGETAVLCVDIFQIGPLPLDPPFKIHVKLLLPLFFPKFTFS